MLSAQKDKFTLNAGTSYLNCAYMAPVPRSSQAALERRLIDLEAPYRFKAPDWFESVDELRRLYAQILGVTDASRIAITPSCSYSVANVAKQVRPVRGSNIVVAQGQFPSNYYSWKRLCLDHDCELRAIAPDKSTPQFGRSWNEAILDAIDAKTALVSLPPLFHADGTRFDLKSIGELCRARNALFIVDGTQAIGAMDFDFDSILPDAVVCASYKWLLGPYGTGMTYFGSFFDDGIPIEENWITHEGADDFQNLANYKDRLQPVGLRFSSGQHPAFIYIPYLTASARQIIEWGPGQIAEYTHELFRPFKNDFESIGCTFEEEEYMAPHLFGIRFSTPIDLDALKETLAARDVHVSARIDALRISLHLWNDENDLDKLLDCIKAATA